MNENPFKATALFCYLRNAMCSWPFNSPSNNRKPCVRFASNLGLAFSFRQMAPTLPPSWADVVSGHPILFFQREKQLLFIHVAFEIVSGKIETWPELSVSKYNGYYYKRLQHQTLQTQSFSFFQFVSIRNNMHQH